MFERISDLDKMFISLEFVFCKPKKKQQEIVLNDYNFDIMPGSHDGENGIKSQFLKVNEY